MAGLGVFLGGASMCRVCDLSAENSGGGAGPAPAMLGNSAPSAIVSTNPFANIST